ncbi:AmmeMemoRadiSam system protein B [Nitrospirota bacterium]
MNREPAVAGKFYPDSAEALSEQVRGFSSPEAVRQDAIAAVCPHAGLMYSGSVAGLVYSHISIPETFILIGPNHTGLGPKISVMAEGTWEIPTGRVPIDMELANAFLKKYPLASTNTEAHMYEHSLEVQLPFIVHNAPKAKIVPITVMGPSHENILTLGQAIASTIEETDKKVIIIASSDMSHFISDEDARARDQLAIAQVLALNPDALMDTVHKNDISMCGYAPTTIMIHAALALGAKEAELLMYTTSGEVSGDFSSVVGYAGIVVR